MKVKSALALMMAAGMMAPQTVNNPVTGQTIQQQLKSNERVYKDRFGAHKTRIKSRMKRRGAFIVLNQRQKRKRWRQSPHKRPKHHIM